MFPPPSGHSKPPGLWRPHRNRFEFRKFRTCRRLKQDVSVENIRALVRTADWNRAAAACCELAAWARADQREASRSPMATMDFPPCAGPDLFFRVLFASISDKRTRRHERSSSRQGLSSGGHIGSSGSAAILVRPHAAVEWFRQSDADGNLLGRIDCFGNFGFQRMAARNAPYLFRVLSVVRSGCAGFFRVSIGWDAARNGFHIVVFCAAWILVGIRTKQSPVARQHVLAAMGMVPDLFRIGSSEDSKRRSHMAQFHGHGQLLSKWPPAHMDWMVRAAFSALVSCGNSRAHVCG